MSDWYVSTTGNSGNSGTAESPWDLVTALASKHATVQPGDTIWIAAGNYVHPDRSYGTFGYIVRLYGSSAAPITVRPVAGAHVIVDGGMQAYASAPYSTYVHIHDLEVLTSEAIADDRVSTYPGNDPIDLIYPSGGVHLPYGSGIKIINCAIHGNANSGIGFWASVDGDSEIYGCVIYDNGWLGSDRAHGHGIYGQNNAADGKYKHIRHCFFAQSYDLDYQMYGSSSAQVNNFNIDGNIHWWRENGNGGSMLVGGSNPASNKHLHWRNNLCGCSGVGFGYAVGGEDLVVENNVLIWGNMNSQTFDPVSWPEYPEDDYNFWWHDVYYTTTWSGLLTPNPEDGVPIPSTPLYKLHLNEYDVDRAHVGAVGFNGESSVTVDVSGWLNNGDQYELLDPLDRWGAAVDTGSVSGGTITVPFTRTLPAFINEPDFRFDAYIIHKISAAPTAGAVQRIVIGCLDGATIDSAMDTQVIAGGVTLSLGEGATPSGNTLTSVAGDVQPEGVDTSLYNIPYYVRIVGDATVQMIEPFRQRIVGGATVDAQQSATVLPTLLVSVAGDVLGEGVSQLLTAVRHRIPPSVLRFIG